MPLRLKVIVFLLLLSAPSERIVAKGVAAYNAKHTEVALRMIGHQLLLESGDSSSRILPIEKEGEQYRVRFDTEFELDPGRLVSIIDKVALETKLASGYIVEVQSCDSGQVVYSYEIAEVSESDIRPCGGRLLPEACYTLLFTLNPYIGPEEPLIALDPTVADGRETETSEMNYPLLALLLVAFVGMLVVYWRRRHQQNTNPNLIYLGDYQFDKRNTELLLANERIDLTSKEADLLNLLYETANTTIERDVILNRVWGDEGGYVGRTLDVFISKLRKKLDADPRVKIVNIRGVGYKLVLDI